MSDVPTRELAGASPEAQHRALLEVAEAISQHRDLGELFHELAERLHRVVEFEYLNLILHDPARNVMRLHILDVVCRTGRIQILGRSSGKGNYLVRVFHIRETHWQQFAY